MEDGPDQSSYSGIVSLPHGDKVRHILTNYKYPLNLLVPPSLRKSNSLPGDSVRSCYEAVWVTVAVASSRS